MVRPLFQKPASARRDLTILAWLHTISGQDLKAAPNGWRTCWMAVISMSVLALIIVSTPNLLPIYLGRATLTVKSTVQFTYILAAMLPILGVDVAISGRSRVPERQVPVLSTFSGLIRNGWV